MILDLPVKYALFDMDGTLTDTMHFWSNIPARLLAAEGLTLAPKEEKKLSTLGIVDGIKYIHSLHLSERSDHFGYEDVVRILTPSYEGSPVAKQGVHDLLAELNAKGVRMGVATLTPSHLARACLVRVGLIDYFDFILGGEDYPEGKSGPRIFLDAAKNFGCAPAEMHLFEDSLYSIKTARELGISVVGVYDDHQKEEKDAVIAASVAYFEDGFSRRVK